MRRNLAQMSLADGVVNQRAGRNGWLDRIDSIVDWPAVVKVLDGIYASDEGRPSAGDVCEAAFAAAMVRFV